MYLDNVARGGHLSTYTFLGQMYVCIYVSIVFPLQMHHTTHQKCVMNIDFLGHICVLSHVYSMHEYVQHMMDSNRLLWH